MCKFRLLRIKNHLNRYHFPISGLKRLTISAALTAVLALSFGAGSAVYGQNIFLEFFKNGDTGLLGALSVTVSPDDKHVYVASSGDDAVGVFNRNATTGKLTFVEFLMDGGTDSSGNLIDGLNAAFSVALSPDGKHFYVAAFDDDAVAVFEKATVPPLCTLAAETDTNQVNTEHTVTVTVKQNGAVQQGVAVTFDVFKGPNMSVVGVSTSPTDANGQATFTYTGGNTAGTDSIVASGTINGVPFECFAEKVWIEFFVEEDVFPLTVATIDLGPGGIVTLTGPMTVNVNFEGANQGDANDDDGVPDGLDEVQTEIVAMTLTGQIAGVGQIVVALNPAIPSVGEIEEDVDNNTGTLDVDPFTMGDTAQSFFDMFVLIDFPPVLGIPQLHNEDPIRIQTQISSKPPAQGETFTMTGGPVFLLDADNQITPMPLAIFNVTHTPNPIFDFGDAPDADPPVPPLSYPTLLANDGARHNIIAGIFLGTAIDPDIDGFGDGVDDNGDATDDDTEGIPDNEDGVVFNDPFAPDSTIDVDVTASVAGKLNAWVDFNGNGSWADAGEQIFTDEVLAGGLNSLSFTVPSAVVGGTTFTRFRFDTGGGLDFVGLAGNGEVEDYEVNIVDNECTLVVATDTNQVNTDHTVTVTVKKNNLVQPGVVVTFEVFKGPNMGDSGTGMSPTDGGGQATFTYTGDGGVGVDSIKASGTINGIPFECFAEKVWVDNQCTLAAATDTNHVGTEDTVTVAVKQNNVDQAGVVVTFDVFKGPNIGTTGAGTGLTDSSGQVTFSYTSNGTAGIDSIVASGTINGVLFECYAEKVWVDPPTGVEDPGPLEIPTEFALQQNYPNPFNPETTIRFELPQASEVNLLIYNVQGQLVRKLVSESREAGFHQIVWDARDDAGRSMPSGVYLYRIQTGGFTETRKLMLMR